MSVSDRVRQFLKFLIESTHAFYVEDDGRVFIEQNASPLTLGDPPREVFIYNPKGVSNNSIIVNPFAEGLGIDNPGSTFFYGTIIQKVPAARISIILKRAVDEAILQKAKKGNDGTAAGSTDPGFLNVVSALVAEADDKLNSEIESIINTDISYLFTLVYSKRNMQTRLVINLLNDEAKTKFPNIRKKSIEALRKALLAIFGCASEKDLERFTCKATETEPPRLGSQLRSYFKVFEQINPIIEQTEIEYVIDLGGFKAHLDCLSDYYKNARWQNSVDPKPQQVAPQTVANAIPVQTVPMHVPMTVPMVNGVPIDTSRMRPHPSQFPGSAYANAFGAPPPGYNQMAPGYQHFGVPQQPSYVQHSAPPTVRYVVPGMTNTANTYRNY